MPRFRTNHVVIEARQLTENHVQTVKIAAWCNGEWSAGTNHDGSRAIHWITIKTPKGKMLAVTGDWIIKDAGGNFTACPSDVFDSTYEAVES